jgi:hypothetical protein
MQKVRSRDGTPTAADFSSADGSPLVQDRVSGQWYALGAGDTVYPIGPVNVKGYGAKGDGTTDDTTAIQSAIDTGQRVVFPPGNYKITAALETFVNGQIIGGEGMESGKYKITRSGAGAALVIAHPRVKLHDLEIVGTASADDGVVCYNANRCSIERLNIQGFDGYGIKIDQDYAVPDGNNNFVHINEVICNQNNIGIGAANIGGDHNGIEVISAWCGSNDSHGLVIKGQNWRVFGGDYEGNGGYGVLISESGDAAVSVGSMLYHPWVEANTLGGVRGGGRSARNCYWSDNSQQTLTNAANSEDLQIVVDNSSGAMFKLKDGVNSLEFSLTATGTPRSNIYSRGTNPRLDVSPTGAGDLHLGSQTTGNVIIDGASGATGYTKALRIGTWFFWVDSVGDFRKKSTVPTSDTDGAIV